MTADHFDDFRAALLRGDSDAVAEAFRLYGQRLVALAHCLLAEHLRAKVDAEDVVQSAFRSFVARCGGGLFRFDDAESPWRMLVRITVRKCHRRHRQFHGRARDVRREVAGPDRDQGPDFADAQPTPEEALLLGDTVQELMARLGSQRKRDVCELSLQGYSVAEISERLGFYERGVLRVRAEIKKTLLELLEAE